MSSIIGKQFENKNNRETSKVVSIDGNIAVLENDQRISIERLLDSNHYVEMNSINESNLDTNMNNGSSLHNNLFNQIQELSNDSVNNAANHNGGAAIDTGGSFVNPVESHHDAQRRVKGDDVRDVNEPQYNAMIEKAKRDQLELDAKMKRQAAKMAKTVEGIEEEVTIPVNRNLEGATMEGVQRETSVNVIEDIGSDVAGNKQTIQTAVNPMFTKMKRTKKVSLKIDINEMMPSKDLLKMLEEGFEDSVLDYLTNEIAGKVLTDNTIKSQIKSKLKEYVYGKPRAKRKTAKKTVAKKKTN